MALTIVGDVDQLLYRFAGAKPELMTEEVHQYIPDMLTHFLDINFRSTRTIVEACNKLIERNYSDCGGPYPQELMKPTKAREDAPEGDPITFQMFDGTKEEAQGVANIIKEQIDQHDYKYGDFYVSARTRAQLGYLEGPLYRAGIKFVNIAGGSFWQNYHVANIVAFLQLAHDTSNDAAFKRVYNIASASHTDKSGNYCHHHWMGAEFLRLTKGQYRNMHLAVNRNRRYYYGVTDLENFVNDVRMEMAYASNPSMVINFIIKNCYKQWLKAKGESIEQEGDSNILDDIETVMDVAKEYDTVAGFLTYVQEMSEAAEEAKKGNMGEYVVLSTVHRLKGSERPIMVGVGWCEGSNSAGDPRGLLPHTFALTPPPVFGVLPTSGMARIEDERDIAFVCVSRAQDKVFLTAPASYRDNNMTASRFVYELGATVVNLSEDVADEDSDSDNDESES